MNTEQQQSDREFYLKLGGAKSTNGIIAILVVGVIVSVSACCTGLVKRPHRANEEGQPFQRIVEKIKSSVAFVDVLTNVSGVSKTGTAFLLSKQGLVVTCYHTLFDTVKFNGTEVIPDTTQIWLDFDTHGGIYQGEVLMCRRDKDIALIRVELTPERCDSFGLQPVELGGLDIVHEGADVACTGYDLSQTWKRFGRKYHWLTTHKGIISCVFAVGPAPTQHYVDRFQLDAVVNKGASGGPVYSVESGAVIGMIQSFKGLEKNGLVVNYGIANCIPTWAIVNLIKEWRDSDK